MKTNKHEVPSKRRRPGPHVGDRVRFVWGVETVEGTIVEDRGPLGGGGRHLYRIEFWLSGDEPLPIELAASEFEVIAP